MNRKEKNELKESLSSFFNFANGRFKDEEMDALRSIADHRDEYNGQSRTRHDSYKTFDSEDTYRVNETETYSFHSDDSGIRIDRDLVRDWDDGQRDTEHETFDTARSILNNLGKVIRRKS
mgnify:CR=1 FL=1|jgi:hypothetical protein